MIYLSRNDRTGEANQVTTEKRAAPSVASALSDAQAIVEAAKKRAGEIDAETERVRQQAFDRGYRDGFQRGLSEASEKAVRMMEQTASVEEVLSHEAARLAVAICESLILEQIQVDSQVVVRIAKQALQESVIGDSVVIVVNPQDEATVQHSRNDLRKVSGGSSLGVEVDPNVARGGCVIRTEFGEVDASLDALLQTVRTRLGIKP